MPLLEALESSALARLIIGSTWGFPIAEVSHLCFITVVFGAMVLMDLRLLGLMKAYPIAIVMPMLLRGVWFAFAGATVTGCLLFITMATRYVEDLAFVIKMALLLLAGINALFMHNIAMKHLSTDVIHAQGTQAHGKTPLLVRCSALLSPIALG